MAFRLAVIADTHLLAITGTAQEACLDWALAALQACPPDLLVVAGDVTAVGAAGAARACRRKLDRTGLPCLLLPGNSDLRSPAQEAAVRQALTSPCVADHPECRVVTLDTGAGEVPAAARRAVARAAAGRGDRALVLVLHYPPEALAPESRDWCAAWLREAQPSLVVAAHSHRDREYTWAGVPVRMVRGLDPDKASGGPPAVAVFEWRDRRWHRRDRAFPGGTATGWSAAARQELLALLGLACPGEAAAGLRRAATAGVARVELRATAAAQAPEVLAVALRQWRAAGGQYLSWHLPDVPWAEDEPAAAQRWTALLDLGLASGLQSVTVHLPRVPVGLLRPGSATWHRVSAAFCRCLEPVVARGLGVAVENMHLGTGEPADASRRYGCLPGECLAWLAELRRHLGREAVGLLLDVGHARNNGPFASEFTLGAWYALVGRQAAGYHVHQVVASDGGLTNHQPLTGLHEPLLSLSSFLWAWRSGQLSHAPVFLEVRDDAGQQASLQALRKALQGQDEAGSAAGRREAAAPDPWP